MSKATIDVSKYYTVLDSKEMEQKAESLFKTTSKLASLLDRATYEQPTMIDVYCERSAEQLSKNEEIMSVAEELIEKYIDTHKETKRIASYYTVADWVKEDGKQVKGLVAYENLLRLINTGVSLATDLNRAVHRIGEHIDRVEELREIYGKDRDIANQLYIDDMQRGHHMRLRLLNGVLKGVREGSIGNAYQIKYSVPFLQKEAVLEYLVDDYENVKLVHKRLEKLAQTYDELRVNARREVMSEIDLNVEELENILKDSINKYESNKSAYPYRTTVWENELKVIAESYMEMKDSNIIREEKLQQFHLEYARKYFLEANCYGVPLHKLARDLETVFVDCDTKTFKEKVYRSNYGVAESAFLLYNEGLKHLGKALYHRPSKYFKIVFSKLGVKRLYMTPQAKQQRCRDIKDNPNILNPQDVRELFASMWAYEEGREYGLIGNWYRGYTTYQEVKVAEPNQESREEKLYQIILASGDKEAIAKASKLVEGK